MQVSLRNIVDRSGSRFFPLLRFTDNCKHFLPTPLAANLFLGLLTLEACKNS